MVKMAVFGASKLISRKIRVEEKYLIFHTVGFFLQTLLWLKKLDKSESKHRLFDPETWIG